jgi:uncharacterized repeat protein (TIGR03803 family)
MLGAAPSATVAAATETVLYAFKGAPGDGEGPYVGLIADKAGNLYGTTELGGTSNAGVVFKLAPDGTETVLYTFTGHSDGGRPFAGLLSDKAGNLYGTTSRGGASNEGVVFKLAPEGTETVLYAFKGGSDGRWPEAGLIADKAGNLYGTTPQGGASGAGVVFKLAPDGTETVLYAFKGDSDGDGPTARLIADGAGNLYGMTLEGGASGAGVVFKLAPDGTETVLYAFKGGSDGRFPRGGLIADKAGNLYGTTLEGGASGAGVVFKLAPDGTETVLYAFTDHSDGGGPFAGLIADGAGNLYGTTRLGGAYNGASGAGVVFKLAPDGTETVLYTFTGESDGGRPFAGLLSDKAGNLYGTAYGGASDRGVVFKLAGTGFGSPSPATAIRSPVTQSSPSPALASAADLYAEAKRYLEAKDYAQALQLFQKAAAAGDAQAMYELGELYNRGVVPPFSPDYAQARQWYEKAAAASHAQAMFNLGWLYQRGLGVPQDYAQARRWYEKAAAAGNAQAMNFLGNLYANGHGVAQDYAQARRWYERAAPAGDASAMYNLGYLSEYGLGVAQDYVQARQWYQKAADAGDPDAKDALERLPSK